MVDLPRVGETFDRYRIDFQVGFGGMGVVFAATDLRLGRRVALKVIAAQLAADDEFRQRFEREAEIMTRLDSPHVLAIFDHGVHEGLPWLSTQLVGGGDLGTLLRSGAGLGLPTSATIAAQVAGALHDAHRAGVVHRDVKPSNVLLRGESAEPHAYLCDFGIAHSGTSGLTATGRVAGSWAYIAPERTTGDPGSPASDIYSLGCLFWACLTGGAPYAGSDVEIALAHVQAPVPQLVGTDETTVRINAVLRRALAKDPTHRYRSAEDLRRDLVALSRLDAPGYVPAVPAAFRSPTDTGTTMRRTDDPRPGRRPRRRRWLLGAAALALVAGGGAVAAVQLVGDESGGAAALGGGVPGDVDGDGRGDLVFRWYGFGDGYKPSRDLFVRSTGEGYAAPERWETLEGLGTIGDVDGDGRADRVGLDNVTGTERVTVQTSLADGSSREVTWKAHGFRSDAVPRLGDLDGDGRDDLVLASDLRQDDRGVGSGVVIEVAMSTADGFAEPTTWLKEPEWDQFPGHFVPGDVDGDGTDELLVRMTADNGSHANTPKVTRLHLLRAGDGRFTRLGESIDVKDDVALNATFDIGDVDGDGAGEIITYVTGNRTGEVRVLEVQDGQVRDGEVWLRQRIAGFQALPHDRFLTDVDGDGHVDLVLLPEQGRRSLEVTVALGTGEEFRTPRTWTTIDCINDPCDETWSILGGGT